MASSVIVPPGWFPAIPTKDSNAARKGWLSKTKQKKIDWNKAARDIRSNQADNNLIRPQDDHIDFLRRARQLNLNLIDFSHNPNYEQIRKWSHPLNIQVVEPAAIYSKTSGVPNPKWIREREELIELVTNLETCSEFALDTEAHSTDTKQGFIALIQVSTWEFGDFLIDATKLHKDITIHLKRILENTSIVKLLHGGENDILWLQQCYSIYIGGIMDTQILYNLVNGVSQIGFNDMALAFYPSQKKLLEVKDTFSDWRLRSETGFTEKQKIYATNDTHFLLHVYNQMKRILKAEGDDGIKLINKGFELSKDACLSKLFRNKVGQQTSPFKLTDELIKTLAKNKQNFLFSETEKALIDVIMEWRRNIGNVMDRKDEDVLNGRAIARIARENPKTMEDLNKIIRDTGNKEGNMGKQMPILFELVTERNIEKLRDVECLRCLKKGHGPAIFCPSDKIPGNRHEYFSREENRPKVTAMNKRRRDLKTPEQRAAQRARKKQNKRLKLAEAEGCSDSGS